VLCFLRTVVAVLPIPSYDRPSQKARRDEQGHIVELRSLVVGNRIQELREELLQWVLGEVRNYEVRSLELGLLCGSEDCCQTRLEARAHVLYLALHLVGRGD
jgi:hypothetical protein